MLQLLIIFLLNLFLLLILFLLLFIFSYSLHLFLIIVLFALFHLLPIYLLLSQEIELMAGVLLLYSFSQSEIQLLNPLHRVRRVPLLFNRLSDDIQRKTLGFLINCSDLDCCLLLDNFHNVYKNRVCHLVREFPINQLILSSFELATTIFELIASVFQRLKLVLLL
jgi:hypothetical protein